MNLGGQTNKERELWNEEKSQNKPGFKMEYEGESWNEEESQNNPGGPMK